MIGDYKMREVKDSKNIIVYKDEYAYCSHPSIINNDYGDLLIDRSITFYKQKKIAYTNFFTKNIFFS